MKTTNEPSAPVNAHTPGPWVLDYDKGSTQDILSRKHGGICTVRRAGRHDNETFAANARLIAAAPELLAALKDALRSLDSLSSEVFDHKTPLSGLIDPRNASTIRAGYSTIAKVTSA